MKIYSITVSESGEESRKFVEDFEEMPAPAVTLGGRLLALKNESSLDHIAV